MNSAMQHSPLTTPAMAGAECIALSDANISASAMRALNVTGWSHDTDFGLSMKPVGKQDASAERFEPCTYVMQMARVQY